VVASSSPKFFMILKSASFTCPKGLIKIFSGLMSLWITFLRNEHHDELLIMDVFQGLGALNEALKNEPSILGEFWLEHDLCHTTHTKFIDHHKRFGFLT
jgi:hypothetical protein